MSNQAQNPNRRGHLQHSGIWISIVIWVLTFGFA
jgi:hypothetical protein